MKSTTSTVKRKDEEMVLKALAAEAPVGVCIMQGGRFCYVNSYFPIAIGYSVDELIGRDSSDIVVPEDREMVNENTRRMLRGELLSPYQFRVICKDGSIVWVMATVRSVDYLGKQAILGSYMEVTERTRMISALRESEERYRLLANSITDVFFAMDEGLRYSYWNKASEILTGILAKDAIGKSIQEVFPDTPWRRKAEKVYRQVLKTQQFQTFVNDYDRGGKDYVFEISVYPSQGGISVFVKDVTERKQAEAALNLQKAYFQQLFDSSPDAIVMLDTDTKVVQANEGFERLFGYSLEEIKGRAIKELIVPEDHLEETSAVSRTVSNGQVFRKEFVRIRKDGSPIDVSLVAYPIRLDSKVVGTYSIYSDITKHKQMEQTLREAEEEKSTLLEEAPVSIIHADLEGRVTYVNRRFEIESGYSREEVIGKTAFGLGWFSDDTAKYLAERMAARLRGEAAKHWETQFRCKDGHWIWIELEGKVISKLGSPVGYQIVASNVTERKEAEEALRQSEEKYRTILEEMEDAYFEVDLGGHLTFVNNSVCRDLGYWREELVGTSYRAFTAENDIDSVFRVFNEVYRTGVPNKGFPWKTIRKDGVQGFAETSISPLRDNTGEIIGFRGVGRDITDRRKTEQKLRQSEENYRTLFNNSVIGTVVLDAETARIVMINQAALKMFGFTSPEEASREEAFDFVLPDDKERYMEITKTAVSKQNSHEECQVRALTKDGREIWINMTAAKVMHESRLAILISFTDITEQMRQRERLMMTDRMASLGELAAGTAHELNNPLTSILGFSQLLMERNVPDDIREDVKIIYSEAQRAANVTKDLLTFARKQSPVKQLNQINSVVEDVLELRAYVHEMNGIDVKKHLARDLPDLMVDYFQMQQVFLNIIINAEYFMIEAHNGGTLTITTKKQNGAVLISIADDGPGIPPENLKRIFDPFFTTKEAGKGTGLGLSICHGIVTEHGGQICVKSELGKGAIVLVELPVKGQRTDSELL